MAHALPMLLEDVLGIDVIAPCPVDEFFWYQGAARREEHLVTCAGVTEDHRHGWGGVDST